MDELDIYKRRFERERRSRQAAEQLLEEKSRTLYATNNQLKDTLQHLESLVEERTKDLQLALKEARAGIVAKTEFLANMSHEIRTPMNGILGMIELCLDEDISESVRKKLDVAIASGKDLLQILNDILDLSKMQSGKLLLNPAPTNLKAVLEQVLQLRQGEAQQKDVALVLNIDAALPTTIIVDSMRLSQILNNLMGNAIKFTEKGQITLSAEQEEISKTHVKCLFKLEDTGIGIPTEKLPHIFQKFTQVDASTAKKYGGTGLGLSIVEEIVALLEGRVWVESTVGKGTTFFVACQFPISENALPADPEKSRPQKEYAFPNKHILVVEDNKVNQLVVMALLKKVGVKPNLVVNGFEAVEYVRHHDNIDLILMDCQMPEMDGFEATQRIKRLLKTDKKAAIPIIALTANATPADKEKCFASGMDDYLSKPIDSKALFEKLDHFLSNT